MTSLGSVTDKYISVFNRVFALIYLSFVFLVLSLGKVFSLVRIGPVYITEAVIFFGLFFIFFNAKEILKITHKFLLVTSLYLSLGSIYFIYAILFKHNIAALRDIVFFIYILFLPVTFIIFLKPGQFKKLLFIIILANLIGISYAHLCFRIAFTSITLHIFFGIIKAFNFLLYFGITLSFLIPLFFLVKKRIYKALIILLCALNLYIIMLWAERSAWIAVFAQLTFFILLLKKTILKFLPILLLTFFAISSVFILTFDAKNFQERVWDKAKTTLTFFKDYQTLQREKKIMVTKEWMERWRLEGDSSVFRVADEDKKAPEFYINLGWRLEIWKRVIKDTLKSPFLGRGFGIHFMSYKVRPDRITKPYSGVIPLHNHILAIFYKMGLLGVGLFFYINIYVFRYGLRYLKETKNDFLKCFLTGCLGSFIFWHTMAVFIDVIDSPPTSIFLWIIIGLIFACVEIDKKAVA